MCPEGSRRGRMAAESERIRVRRRPTGVRVGFDVAEYSPSGARPRRDLDQGSAGERKGMGQEMLCHA